MADSHVVLVLVEDELLALLVDRVVGEVHADVVDVVLVRSHVGLSGKPAQPLAENVHAKRVNTRD